MIWIMVLQDRGCYNTAINAALKTYFDYSSSQAWDWRANYTDPQWLTLVKAELDGGHPLIYYGNNASTNGHFFNCDGYNDSDYLHINWGWSGAYNRYFQVTSLVPLSGYVFTDNQGAIFGAYPNATTSYCTATSQSCNLNWIERVQLESIDTATSCDNYTDYSASCIANLTQGVSYTIRLNSGHLGVWTNSLVNCWVDWNQDFDFDDSGEAFSLTYLYNSGFPNATGVYQGTVVVPAGATTGTTTMRVRITDSQTANTSCGTTQYGEVEDYGIVVGDDSPPPGSVYPFVFSVDIGSDTELSDIQADGDEVFDPGDAYLYNGALLPAGGADGLVNDASLFFTDPAPIPGQSGTNAPIGSGGDLPAPLLFDMDGIDYTVVPVDSKDYGPGLPSVQQYDDSLIFPPEFFLISYDDDTSPNYTDATGSVAVNSFSPSSLSIFGKSNNKDEILEVDFPISYTYPVGSNNTGNVTDEFPLHYNLNPNPDPNNTPDDDVDALDIYNENASPYGFIYFSADHEAYYVDPNTSTALNPGNIYMANAGGGTFIEVINAQLDLGLNPDTDVDAFEFSWLQDAQMGYVALALLFSVDDDDPLTPADESGGLNSRMIYASFLNGAYFSFSEEALLDDIDAISIGSKGYIPGSNIPDADFGSDLNLIPVGNSINFTDLSSNSPTSWAWSFSNGTPLSYNGQVPPPVYYNTAGSFDVALTATNSYGGNTETKTSYIEVVDYPTGWEFTKTASSHLISVPDDVIFPSIPLAPGDFFGVFYLDELGQEKCGGANVWDGVNSKVVVAFGDDPTTSPVKDGFDAGEAFIWKAYYTATSTEKYAEVSYNISLPNADGLFYDNGLSALLTMDTDPLRVDATVDDDDVCEGDEIQLDAVTQGGTGSYTYTWTSRPSGFNSPLQNPVANPTETLKYFVMVDDGISQRMDSVSVTVTALPTVNAGSDDVICEINSYNPVGSATSYSTVLWTTTGDGNLMLANSLTPTYWPGPNDKANGSVTLTLTANPVSPCILSDSDDVTATINRNPVCDAGSDESICETDDFYISGSSAQDYLSLEWITNGDGSFDDNTLLHPTYSPGSNDITNGTVGLSLTAYPNNPCVTSPSSNISLDILYQPEIAAGDDLTICEGSDFIPTSSASNYDYVEWSTSGDGTFDDEFLVSPTYTPGTADIANGTVTLTIEAEPLSPCVLIISDDVILDITKSPVSQAGLDDSICVGETITLQGIASNHCGSFWSTNGDGEFDDETLPGATYTPGTADIAAGTVELCLLAKPCNPCMTSSTDCMILSIQAAPVAIAGSDVTICEGEDVPLSGSVENACGNLWSTTGDGSFDDETQLVTTFTPGTGDISAGSVEVCLTAQACDPCLVDDTKCFTVYITVYPTVSAGDDAGICEGDSHTLSGSVQDACGQLWSTAGDGSFDDDTSPLATYTPGSGDIAAGTVELCLTGTACDPCAIDANDCMVLSIQKAPVAIPGLDITICEDDTPTLSGAVENSCGNSWATAGDGSFDDDTQLDATYTPGTADIAAGSVELCLTAEACDPCTINDTECITIIINRYPVAAAGDDVQLCEGESYTLLGSVTDNCQQYWTTDGDGSFDDNTLVGATYTPGEGDVAAGTVELCLTAEACAPCDVDSTDCMTISIYKAPVAIAGDDVAICLGDTPALSGSVENDCGHSWSTNGDGTFDDNSLLDVVYTPGTEDIAAGSVEVCLSAQACDPCVIDAVDCLIITINQDPVAAAGDDVTICNGETVTLEGVVEHACEISWITSGDGTFNDNTLPGAIYTPGEGDIVAGSVELCLTAVACEPCSPDSTDCMTISIEDAPVAIAGDDLDICEGETPTLSGSVSNACGQYWTTSGDGHFDDNLLLAATYTPGSGDIVAGSAELCLHAEACDPCTLEAIDCLTISITSNATANAGDDVDICEGSTYTLAGTVTNVCGQYWTTDGDGTFDDNTLTGATYTPGEGDIEAGLVELCLTGETCDPCTVDATDCMVISIVLNPVALAGDDAAVCENEDYMLSGSVENACGQYWTTTGDGDFDDNTLLAASYTPGSEDIANGSVELCLIAEACDPCTENSEDCMTLTIQKLPLAVAGDDFEICETETPTLAGSVENACGQYWTTGGDGNFDDNSLLAATYTSGSGDIETGSVELCLHAEACDPCTLEAVDCLTISIAPAPVSFAGDDVDICAGSSYTLLGTVENACGQRWTSNGDGTFDDNTLTNATYTPGEEDIASGSVGLCLKADACDPCTMHALDCVVISIIPNPVAMAGDDAGICEGETHTLAGSVENACGQYWTTSGDGTFDDNTLLTAVYTPGSGDIATGTVDLCLFAEACDPCTENAEDCLTITIHKAAIAIAGDDMSICEGETATLAGQVENACGQYWATNGDGTFNDNGLLAATYTPGSGDIEAGSVELCLYAEACDPCVVDGSDCLTISISLAPLADAGDDADICAGSSYTLSGMVENTCGQFWTTGGDGTFDDIALTNATYTPGVGDLEAGTIELCLTGEACDPCVVDATDCMIITITANPVAMAGDDADICDSETYTLAGSVENACGQYWTTDGDGIFDDNTLLAATYAPGSGDIAAGNVGLCLVAKACDPCLEDTEDCLILTIQPSPNAYAGDDLVICESETPILAGSVENACGQYWTTAGDGTFDDNHLLAPTYTPGSGDIEAGTVELCLFAEACDPCTIDAMDCLIIEFQLNPVAMAGDDAGICEGETHTLAGSVENACGQYWTTGGDGSFDDNTLLTAVYTPGSGDIATGTVDLCLFAQACDPCTENAENCLTITIQKTAIAIAGDDMSICENGTAVLAGSVENACGQYWTTNGDGIFDDNGLLNATYTPGSGDIDAGTVELCLFAEACDPCVIDGSDCLTISISHAPLADAGDDADICSGSTYTLSGMVENTCGQFWTTGGDGTFDDIALTNATYTPGVGDLEAGTVELCLTGEACDPCVVDASDCMQLIIIPNPLAIAGDDDAICESDSYTLAGYVENACGQYWTTNGDGTFDDNTLLVATYTPGSGDIAAGNVGLCLVAKACDPCVEDTEDCLVLTIQPSPIAYAGDDLVICESETPTLAGSVENACGQYWTTAGDGTFDDNHLLAPTYTPGSGDIEAGTVELCLSAEACDPCTIDAMDCLIIEIQLNPVAMAGDNQLICENEIVLLDGAVENSCGQYWTTSGDGQFDDISLLFAAYTPGIGDIEAGLVDLCLVAEACNPCTTSDTDCLDVTIQLLPTAYAGEDAIVGAGGSYFLEDANAENFSDIEWSTSGDGSFDDINLLNATYTPGTGDAIIGSVELCLEASPLNPCAVSANDCMTLSIEIAPVVDAGPDATICETGDFLVTNATALNTSSVEWSTTGDGSFDDNAVLNPLYTPGSGDIAAGMVELCLTGYPIPPSIVEDTDCMTLFINKFPEANAGEDDLVCENGSYTLNGIVSNACGQLWETGGDGDFDDASLADATYTPGSADIASGSVELCLTAEPCDPCAVSDSDCMTLDVVLGPLVFVGGDATVCEGEDYLAMGVVYNGCGQTWETSGDGTFDDNTLMMATYTAGSEDLLNGSVELCITGLPCDPCTIAPTECITLYFAPAPIAGAGDDISICAGETVQITDAFVENACGQFWTTSGDGGFDDNSSLSPVYTPGSGDITAGTVELCLDAIACDPCTVNATSCITITILETQVISLAQGWQGLSGYIEPYDTDIEVVVNGILDELVIMYNLDNEILYPAYNLNTLNNWNSKAGYFIKVEGSTTLNICGTEEMDKTIQLLEGWNVIPVLTAGNDVPVAEVFDAISDQLIVIKEIAGSNLYYPLYGISSLSVLERGNAYLVKVSADCSITFPDVVTKTGLLNQPQSSATQNPWNEISITPASHLIVVTENALPVIEKGDVLGVFNSQGLCVGSVCFENADGNLPLSVFSDDFTTEEADGMLEQELMNFVLYRNGETFELEVEFDQTFVQNDGLFVANGISGIKHMKLGAAGINDGSAPQLSVYPNPTEGKVTIDAAGSYEMEVTDAHGRIIEVVGFESSHLLDLSEQPNGVYFIKLTSDASTIIRKVVKQ